MRHWDGYDLTLLQTDTAITGGQSGGALVDDRGRVVGVSTWSWTDANIAVSTSASDDAEIVYTAPSSGTYYLQVDYLPESGLSDSYIINAEVLE